MGFRDPELYSFRPQRGLSSDLVRDMSAFKGEPRWMTELRLDALDTFFRYPAPSELGNWENFDFEGQTYYYGPRYGRDSEADALPATASQTFNRLRRNVPQSMSGSTVSLGAQEDAQKLYDTMRERLKNQGVIFVDMDTAVREFPDIVRQYLSGAVEHGRSKFAALNGAIWSGGSFVYVPSGVEAMIPLQADFRINPWNTGPFERTIIVAEDGSHVEYIEGCAAPIYVADVLRNTTAEIFVKRGASVRYATLQNWSTNVYNVASRRALVMEGGTMEWVDGNLGARVTRTAPTISLSGNGAKGNIYSLALAGPDQDQDTGGDVQLEASSASGSIVSRAISIDGGQITFRPGQSLDQNMTVDVQAEVLHVDTEPSPDTHNDSEETEKPLDSLDMRINEDRLLALMGQGMSRTEATRTLITAFVEPVLKRLPLEYEVELDRLVQLRLDDALA